MNIAMFTDTYYPEINGVASSTSTLRNVLIKNGHNVLIVTTNHYGDKLYFNRKENIIHIPGIKLKSMYDYRLANPLSSVVNKVNDLVVEFNPNVIHLQTEWSVALIGQKIASKNKLPTIYTYHTMWEEYSSYVGGEHFDRIKKAFLRWYTRRNINKCFEFISPSMKTKDYIRSMKLNNYINVIPTGVDFNKFKKDDFAIKKASEKRKELGIPKESKVFLILGRIAQEKSIDVLFDGYYKFKQTYPNLNTRLLVVGGGPLLKHFKDLTKKLNIDKETIFTGAVDINEINIYYHLSDIYISASLTETQGLTYMEAMASSLIVLSRFDNNLINVIIDKETGFVFDTIDDFVDTAYKIINLERKDIEIIHKKALDIIDDYSIDKFYSRVLNVYERAVRKNW